MSQFTGRKEQEFGAEILDDVINWVKAWLTPEDVFDESVLGNWASENGWISDGETWAKENGYVLKEE